MAISFDNALGIHEQAMQFRARRAEVLAGNLINADTPNYKARDVSFRDMLNSQMPNSTGSTSLTMTNSRHISTAGNDSGAQLLYRNPLQASQDGNTVEEQVEMAEFAENTLQFQASVQFLSGKFTGLKNAIRGEV